ADIDLDQARTLATVTLLAIGLIVLGVASRPLRSWKIGLVVAMGLGYVVAFVVPFLRDYFKLEVFWDPAWFYSAIAVAVAGLLIVALPLVIPTRARR
ncbi:MAG TPA: hypothetical protein VMW33_10240, partial [Ilumatobacteraceae bacterium]|nr:hypothetical protein [Ilumatobacteraceae bacterium]